MVEKCIFFLESKKHINRFCIYPNDKKYYMKERGLGGLGGGGDTNNRREKKLSETIGERKTAINNHKHSNVFINVFIS